MRYLTPAIATLVAATIVSGPVLAQEGTSENISLGVECRDTAELTREICFPYRVSKLDVQLLPMMTGAAQIIDQRINDSGCVTVKIKVYGERRLVAEHPGSFQSRQSKAHDPLQVMQCLGSGATVIVKVKY